MKILLADDETRITLPDSTSCSPCPYWFNGLAQAGKRRLPATRYPAFFVCLNALPVFLPCKLCSYETNPFLHYEVGVNIRTTRINTRTIRKVIKKGKPNCLLQGFLILVFISHLNKVYAKRKKGKNKAIF